MMIVTSLRCLFIISGKAFYHQKSGRTITLIKQGGFNHEEIFNLGKSDFTRSDDISSLLPIAISNK